MKKKLFARVFAVVMVAAMLLVSCLSLSAVSVSAPDNATEEDYYSVAFENGVLTVRVNPDKIYDMVKDGNLTKEELAKFIPADVLETLSKGKELTVDDLRDLVANYITVDELKGLVDMLPVDVVRKYFSIDMLTDLVEINELIALIPVDEVMAQVDAAALESLLTDEAMELLLNEKLQDKVVTEAFVEDLINNSTLVDDAFADPAIKAKLMDLVTADVVDAMMNDAVIGPKLDALASSETVVDRIIGDDDALATLENYLTADENDEAFGKFIGDKAVIDALIAIDDIRDFLLDEAVISKLVDNGVVTKDNIRKIFTTEELSALVNDDVIDELMKNEKFIDDIFADEPLIEKIVTEELAKAMYDEGYLTVTPPTLDDVKVAVKTISAARKMLATAVYENEDITIDDYWPHVDFKEFADIAKGSIKDALGDNTEAYDRLFDEVDPAAIIDAIGMDACREIIHNNALEVIETIGMPKVFEYYTQDGIVEALGGYNALVDKKFITVDEVADAAGGYSELIPFFETSDIIDAIGMSKLKEYVDIQDVIDSVGGYSALVKLYTTDELKAIINAIGQDKIKAFVKNEVLANVNVKAIAKDVIDYAVSKTGDVKALVKTCGSRALTILLTEVEYISINGEKVYYAGAFDLNKMIIQILRTIPDINDLVDLPEDAIFAGYNVEAKISGETYKRGINFGFIGDSSVLTNFLKNYVEHFRFDVSDEGDVDLQVKLPEVVADVYAAVLNSSRVPAALKEKLIRLPNLSVGDAKELVESFTAEDINAIIEAVEENVDAIQAKAYAKIDAAYAQYGNKLPDKVEAVANQQKIDAAKAKVDAVLDLFTSDTVENKVVAVRNKILSIVNTAYAAAGDRALIDHYNGNGNFSATAGASVDIFAAIERYINLPDELKLFFKSTVLSFELSTDFTMHDLYRLDLVLADGSTYQTLLPAGTSLDVLGTVSALGNVSSGFVLGDTTEIKVMPAADVKLYSNDLYSVQFVANDKIVDTVFYVKGATSITAPALPAGLDKLGYTVDWEDYELNTVKRLVVEAEYTAIEYTAYFWADAEKTQLVGTDKFTVEDTTLDAPAVPTKAGYNVAWGAYTIGAGDIDVFAEYTAIEYTAYFWADAEKTQLVGTDTFTVEDIALDMPAVPTKAGYDVAWGAYTIEPKDIDVFAEYTAIKYKATFVAGDTVVAEVEFTVEDTQIAEPAVPAKTGYTGAWESYTIEPRDITINAVYTPVTYTATFKADGEVVGTVQFTVEDTELAEPSVPAKTGYTGVWESYTLEAKDITVNAVYTPVVYTATFVADGKVVGTVPFTVEDKSIAEPAVPAKEGYTGKWEDYTLGASDITINAIYTLSTPASSGIFSEGGFWWWLLIIIAILVIVIILLLIFYRRGKDDTTPPAPDPEPIVEPEIEADPEVETEVEPTIPEPTEEVEDIVAEEADELMSDDTALAAVVVVAQEVVATGPKAVVNIGDINDNYNDGDTVTLDDLKAKNLAPESAERLKILASGHLNKHNLTVEANSFSVQAIKMIQLTGGVVVQKK